MSGVRIVPSGDAALVAEFDGGIDPAVNARAIALSDRLQHAAVRGVRDIVPTFRTVAVYFDPLRTDVTRLVSTMEAAADISAPADAASARVVDLPVCYDEAFGPDLDDIARFAGIERDAVVAAHAGREYRVFMLGFLPGFAYMGVVDELIAAPRRTTPRREVPAGSVGIAGQQTGVYPVQSPGGWNLVGRTPVRMISFERDRPALLASGDRVRFRPVDRTEFDRLASAEARRP